MQRGSARERAEVEFFQLLQADYDWSELKLSHFVQAAWDVLEPTTPLLWNWNHELECEYLEAMHLGQIRRLILNVPPRTAKSTICTICFPAWVWLRNPESRWLFGSYADDLARKFSIKRRNLMISDWYKRRWHKRFSLSADQNTQLSYSNDKTGLMSSAGMLGSIVGEGGDYLVIDDPHNPTGIEGEKDRPKVLETFDGSWTTRLNNKKTGRILVVMQRLHDLDLTGHLLTRGGYEHLEIKQEAEGYERHIFPISKEIHTREPGVLLQPERDGPTELEQVKRDLGDYGYSSQHQQSPVPREGGIIKEFWFKYYDALPEGDLQWTVSVDCSFKKNLKTDFVCIQVWAMKGADRYLVEMVRDRMDFPDTVRAFTQVCNRFPQARQKIIEEKANGSALIDTMKGTIEGIEPYNPGQNSKEARLSDAAILFNAGNIHFPRPEIKPWVNVVTSELLRFPRATHDDTVDALSQYCIVTKTNLAAMNRLDRLIRM